MGASLVTEGLLGSHVERAILAGWLITLMVWMLPFAESARLWVIIIVSYVVGLGHFGHIVAGSVQTFYVALDGEMSWGKVLGVHRRYPGRVALVAAINHAQVVSGKNGGRE